MASMTIRTSPARTTCPTLGDRGDDSGQRRGQAALRGGGRELFQARVFEGQLPVAAGGPEVEAGAVPK
jgi:hypothetical protein